MNGAAMRVRDALAQAARTLAPVSDSARLDAELLMAHALGVSRDRMLLGRLDADVPAAFDALVARRLKQEPVAYILGRRAFWTIELEVGPGALVPRPDSETLIEGAIDFFGTRTPGAILDLGTGPGTLLLAALAQWPDARGVGVDVSDAALAYARRNGAALGMAGRVAWRTGDWARGIDGRFDLILANPPYIGTGEALPRDVVGHEPHGALFAGADGLDAYRVIVPDLRRLVAPEGLCVLEIGATQGDAVAALARDHGFAVDVRCDLGGRDRAVLLH